MTGTVSVSRGSGHTDKKVVAHSKRCRRGSLPVATSRHDSAFFNQAASQKISRLKLSGSPTTGILVLSHWPEQEYWMRYEQILYLMSFCSSCEAKLLVIGQRNFELIRGNSWRR
jgi:hypothetical protein